MAHLLDSMAYKGETPWHGLGLKINKEASIEGWINAAGLAWTAKELPVYLESGVPVPGYKALVRSDNGKALSIMSSRYKPVQPREIVEFYQDLTEDLGYELETAGSLKEGKKIWALAKTPHSMSLLGHDKLDNYLLLATSLDGTLSTIAKPTTVRVVCNNTLSIAVKDGESGIKTSHKTKFDPDKVKQALGLVKNSWEVFSEMSNTLAKRKMSHDDVLDFFGTVVFKTDDPKKLEKGINSTKGKQIIHAIQHSPGSSYDSAKGTAWGLLNGLTNWLDYTASRNQDNRLNSAWFGQGAEIKQNAVDFLMGLKVERDAVAMELAQQVSYEASSDFFRSL